MNAVSSIKKTNTFAEASAMLAQGFDMAVSSADHMIQLALDDIEVHTQVREEFEDEDNSLAELGESLAKRQAQNIIVRPNWVQGGKPYVLVAGERRVRSARLAGLTHLWALVSEMTDAEASDLQLAENIHRKNLTQIELAKAIQRDLDQLGSVDAVLAKHQKKSKAWVSKFVGLLTLPEQARRLVRENISADLEVIHQVKTIEKADPVAAKALVDSLQASRGKKNARAATTAVKSQVKPGKKPQSAGPKATARDRSQELPSAGRVFAGAKPGKEPAHLQALAKAYVAIFEDDVPPLVALEDIEGDAHEAVESFLHTFYKAGTQATGTDSARTVIEGFRNGGFASDGVGAFSLVAYLHGADGKAKFNLLNIFGCVKP